MKLTYFYIHTHTPLSHTTERIIFFFRGGGLWSLVDILTSPSGLVNIIPTPTQAVRPPLMSVEPNPLKFHLPTSRPIES